MLAAIDDSGLNKFLPMILSKRQRYTIIRNNSSYLSSDESTSSNDLSHLPESEVQLPSIPDGIFEYLDKADEANTEVADEASVGKSTLINALANYLTFKDINDINLNDALTLIPTSFYLYDVDADKEIEISSDRLAVTNSVPGSSQDPAEAEAEVEVEAEAEAGEADLTDAHMNERHVVGTSCTQHPRTYEFTTYLSTGRKVICRIIDTPGMGDTRGIQQDKDNMDLIIKYIADYPEINGILMLLKPNNSRLTTWFRFCIKELLKSLHKDCVRNILFMFTNARSTLYRPGDTMPALKKLLNEVKRDSGVDIPINKSNLFMVDNEAYRYLLARGQVNFTEAEQRDFHSSWINSSMACHRLLETIASLESHASEKTVVLYKAREKILELCKPIIEVGASITKNTRALNNHVEALSEAQAAAGDLRSALTVDLSYGAKKFLSHNVLVCAHQDCVKHTSDENGKSMTDYITKCAEPFYLPNSRIGVIGDPLFQGSINSQNEAGRKLESSISSLRSAISRLTGEEARLIGNASSYSAFVKENGIILYNDAIIEYINHLIEEEKGASIEVTAATGTSAGSKSPLQSLSELKQIYESEKRVMVGALAKHTGAIPTHEEMKKSLGLIPPPPPPRKGFKKFMFKLKLFFKTFKP
ncbi:uncharacterized protein BJ171DRAFT_480313 [Polychytrium aggregatum]|uniref:uncharacterized protein n=1 Tax=Polychytrium aggregatum TaxID=110093 RepID=UPI0022FE2967|nr:uncharacterized protein BJ171DRAFT_480313 [Polychytrium aggregatum]KAI9193236.1 hypothetical protein BJ171DRAFT_480313 [Polychytrium aggregatum]